MILSRVFVRECVSRVRVRGAECAGASAGATGKIAEKFAQNGAHEARRIPMPWRDVARRGMGELHACELDTPEARAGHRADCPACRVRIAIQLSFSSNSLTISWSNSISHHHWSALWCSSKSFAVQVCPHLGHRSSPGATHTSCTASFRSTSQVGQSGSPTTGSMCVLTHVSFCSVIVGSFRAYWQGV